MPAIVELSLIKINKINIKIFYLKHQTKQKILNPNLHLYGWQRYWKKIIQPISLSIFRAHGSLFMHLFATHSTQHYEQNSDDILNMI